jgi:hypothetical protein
LAQEGSICPPRVDRFAGVVAAVYQGSSPARRPTLPIVTFLEPFLNGRSGDILYLVDTGGLRIGASFDRYQFSSVAAANRFAFPPE